MPVISIFFGIVVRINFLDHAPPHLHALHGDAEALFDIRTGQVIVGRLPRRETRYMVEWISTHRDDLRRNWDMASTGQATFRIEGLNDE